MTQQEEYVVPLSPENAAVLFIDNQTNLMLGTQSATVSPDGRDSDQRPVSRR